MAKAKKASTKLTFGSLLPNTPKKALVFFAIIFGLSGVVGVIISYAAPACRVTWLNGQAKQCVRYIPATTPSPTVMPQDR